MTALKIPLFLQRKDYDCGAASIKMLLDFFGQKKSYREIIKNCGLTREGLSSYEIGNYFLGLGYAVKIIVWSDYFPGSFFGLDSSKNREKFLKWARRKTLRNDQANAWKEMVRQFLLNGGELLAQPLSAQDIAGSLRQGIPLILGIQAGIFWALLGTQNMQTRDFRMDHFVVPVCRKNNEITVNDPFYGKKRCSMSNLLLACYRTKEEFGAVFVKPR